MINLASVVSLGYQLYSRACFACAHFEIKCPYLQPFEFFNGLTLVLIQAGFCNNLAGNLYHLHKDIVPYRVNIVNTYSILA